MTTLWLCPCLKPHLVVLQDVSAGERFHSYCNFSRQTIDLVPLGPEDPTPRQYLLKRSHQHE